MPGARWFAGAELNYAENVLAPLRFDGAGAQAATAPRPIARDTVAVVHSSELRELDELTWGQLTRAGGGRRRRPALARRRARRSRGRVHAEHPRDARRVPGDRVDRRDLVERRAGVRRAQRDRPLRADRAEGAADASTATATAARTSTARPSCRASSPSCRASSTRCCSATSTRDAELDGALGWQELLAQGRGRRAGASSRCPSTTRCGCSTPPARPACPRRSCRATAASSSSS